MSRNLAAACSIIVLDYVPPAVVESRCIFDVGGVTLTMGMGVAKSIKVLDPRVANKIAAGEVVERPASVVKELVENAIDAGSNDIRIDVRGGGLQLIRVTDNGWGMPPDEVALCIQRHATSKIEKADDLICIATLGFRGEALPSIAAVARLTIVTRRPADEVGSFLVAEHGVMTESGARGCPAGTAVSVQGLFSNFPARLKYVKAPGTEAGHISNLIAQFALAYPEIRFTLTNDGRTAFQSIGDGELFSALIRVYGVSTAEAMFRIQPEPSARTTAKVRGFVGGPGVSRANRNGLSFFVNRRWVQSRSLAFAVEGVCRPLIGEGRHPIAVIDVEVPPDEVDVNVHPTKSEVRFLKDREVFVAVQDAVRRALAENVVLTAVIDRPEASLPSIQHRLESVDQHPAAATLPFPQTAWRPLEQQAPEPPAFAGAGSARRDYGPQLPILRVIGQMGYTFIIAEGPTGIYLVDQHRAHERVLFDRLMKERDIAQPSSQLLLEPAVVELPPGGVEALATHLAELTRLGFVIESFGDRSFLVRAVPAALGTGRARESVAEIIEQAAADPSIGRTGPDWLEHLLSTVACRGAIKAGQALTALEMRELLLQLESAVTPSICPHGAPVMVHLSQAQLEKQFGR